MNIINKDKNLQKQEFETQFPLVQSDSYVQKPPNEFAS